ncbi:MAG: hypothetical protein AAFZ89_00250, partial [Bacteroidota bacterium]
MKSLRYGLIIIAFMACSKKNDAHKSSFDDLTKYQEYISEVSHGIISAKSDIRVVFNQSLESWEKGDELDKDLFRIWPSTKGKVVALDKRTIAFVPETRFKQDTEYKLTLALKEIIANVPKELQKLTFGIRTLKQQFNVYTNPLQSYSKEHQYIEGQLRSADQLTLDNVKKLVKATQKGKSITIKFDETVDEGTQFHFKIDSIKRYTDDSELEVSWSGSKFDIESSGKNSITIPGKNNFTVMGVSVDVSENRTVLINFSDPLKRDQNFKGLVVLEGEDAPRYSTDGNTLKMYP